MLDPSIGYERGICRGIAKYSNLYGPWSFYSIPGRSTRPLPHWPNWDLDGIVLTDQYDIYPCLEKQIPCISVLVRKEIDGVLNVVPDNMQVGLLGAKFFLERGFKHFLHCYEKEIPWAVERHSSFKVVIESAGYKVHEFAVRSDRIVIDKQEKRIEYIKTLPKPIAVFASNDRDARQFIDMCREAEVAVPEEVSVLGVDNDVFICELSNPPLSSVLFNTESAGFDAAKCLHLMIQNKNTPCDKSKILVEPIKVIERQSTSLLAVEDPVVTKAIKYISDNEQRPLQIGDVSDHAGVSVKVLRKKFIQILGRSVHQEIRRVRADYIARLLIETNLTVSEIAYAMGFSCDNHMSRFFQKVKGVTITQYRKKYCNHVFPIAAIQGIDGSVSH